MGRLNEFLEKSVIADLMVKSESGSLTETDVRQATTRQLLQTARIGELFVLDTLEAESKLTDDFQTLVNDLTS